MRNLVYTVCLITLLFGCSKDGAIGPQGEKGEQGPVGIPGKDGAVILQGTGAPASSLGNNGDMYLDKNTTNLYGPKDNNGWGTPLALKGQDGAKGDKGDDGEKGDKGDDGEKGDKGDRGDAGANGSRIFSGTAIPTANIGSVNDYYLRTTTGDLYGPKLAVSGGGTGWNNTPINLKGTANVIATNWFNLESWAASGNNFRLTHIPVPQPILNAIDATNFQTFLNGGGTMLVYISHPAFGNESQVLPVITPSQTVFEWSYNTSGGGSASNRFSIRIRSFTGVNFPSFYETASDVRLRYVLIPPGRVMSGVASVGGRQISVDELKTMSYEQAAAILGWGE